MNRRFKYNFIYRCTVIVWMAVKFICQIYFFTFRHKVWDERTMEKWNWLLAKLAREYRRKAVELGGVLIKVGQFLSTRSDFLPDVFIEELSGLVDRVPPMTFAYAKELIETEWEAPLDTHVAEIQESSIASASIGEVYHATLHNGSEVAIKVQRYRIQEIFRKDFVAMRIVFWIIKVFTSFGNKADLNELYKEIVRVMDRELNFRKELRFGNYFRERYQYFPSIHIPHFYDQLCTEKVLVMEWIDGAKVTDLAYLNRNFIATEKVARTLFDFYIDQFLNPGNFHADPHAGNILVEKDGTVAIIDFGMVGEISKQDTHHFKRLVEGFIVDDYDLVIHALEEMNFLLPNADKKKLKKMIEQTLEMYQNHSFQDMDTQVMEQLGDELSTIVKEQPIQLPADYAYFARAVSIIVGLLFAVYPEVDVERWLKPKIKDWYGRKNLVESIYKQKAKETAEPLFALPRAMLKWLESGEKDREWDKKKHQLRLKHHFYLFLEIITFVMILAGIGLSVSGYIMNMTGLMFTSLILTGLFIIWLNMILWKHYRCIKGER